MYRLDTTSFPSSLLHRARKVAKGLLRPLTNPAVDARRIRADLRALGVRPGGILLVHSSLSALGYVVGGPRAVIDALVAASGRDGTLLIPTHTWEAMEEGCRTFDVRHTRACIGAIPESFRKMPGVKRSAHPTHSVAALGPSADGLLAGHERCATPCGEDTPYDRSLMKDGQILLLGVGLESNTAFHTIEALAGVPYLMRDQADEFELIDGGGGCRHIAVFRHRAGIPRRFGAVEGLLIERGVMRKGTVGRAEARLINGAAFRDLMSGLLRGEPHALLCQE